MTNRSLHNTYAEAGLSNPNDHMPIVFTNWTSTNQGMDKLQEGHPETISSPIANPSYVETENIAEQQLEEAVTNWIRQFQEASVKNIPRTNYRTIPHFNENHLTRRLQIEHQEIYNDIDINGPAIIKFQILTNLTDRKHGTK